ncbi:hypothetical protein [Streptococcus loxodontisalivarius]|uniref:Histidine kinase n=1 Tax=Streptococcus loxodontisalivarius TaxID=1349415 RepID=A0ABS2PUC4_9STRE|nr:hypothetical protein [Streptococcus loxodontisalivarius]MBM7643140.1 hypothetical protein [Streptococcus loxodontisalivarius]
MNDLIYSLLEYLTLFLVEWYIFKKFTGIVVSKRYFFLFGLIYFLASDFCAQYGIPMTPIFFLVIINHFRPNQAPGVRFIQACYPPLVTSYLRRLAAIFIIPHILPVNSQEVLTEQPLIFLSYLFTLPLFYFFIKLAALDFDTIQDLDREHYLRVAIRSTSFLITFYLFYLLQMLLHHNLPQVFPVPYLDDPFWQLPIFAAYSLLLLWDMVNLSKATRQQLSFNIASEEKRHLDDIDNYNHYIVNLLNDKIRYQTDYYNYLDKIYKRLASGKKVVHVEESPEFLHQLDEVSLNQLEHIKINIIRNQLHAQLLKLKRQGIQLQVNCLSDLVKVPISDLEFYQLINFIFNHVSACPKRRPSRFQLSYFKINDKNILLFESLISDKHSKEGFKDIKAQVLKLYPDIQNLLARTPQVSVEITKTEEQINYILEIS